MILTLFQGMAEEGENSVFLNPRHPITDSWLKQASIQTWCGVNVIDGTASFRRLCLSHCRSVDVSIRRGETECACRPRVWWGRFWAEEVEAFSTSIFIISTAAVRGLSIHLGELTCSISNVGTVEIAWFQYISWKDVNIEEKIETILFAMIWFCTKLKCIIVPCLQNDLRKVNLTIELPCNHQQ